MTHQEARQYDAKMAKVGVMTLTSVLAVTVAALAACLACYRVLQTVTVRRSRLGHRLQELRPEPTWGGVYVGSVVDAGCGMLSMPELGRVVTVREPAEGASMAMWATDEPEPDEVAVATAACRAVADAVTRELTPELTPEPEPEPDYASWTVPALRAECKARHLKQAGRKAELVARLAG